MIVKGITLKEKNIEVNAFMPPKKLKVNLNRMNYMPETVPNNELRCEIKVNISLDDDENSVVKMVLSYVVFAQVEVGEIYSQQDFADRIFGVIQGIYMKEVNDLLKETPYPPLPLNLKC